MLPENFDVIVREQTQKHVGGIMGLALTISTFDDNQWCRFYAMPHYTCRIIGYIHGDSITKIEQAVKTEYYERVKAGI